MQAQDAKQAIEELYATYAPALLRYLERLTRSHETAEDLTQETFLKALRSWEQLPPDANVRAWLFRIATNVAYDEFRRRRRSPTTLLTERHLETLAGEYDRPAIDEAEPILAALDRLPARYRVPLVLQGYGGYPVGAIAARLGWKEGTVKSRLHRARARFLELYDAA